MDQAPIRLEIDMLYPDLLELISLVELADTDELNNYLPELNQIAKSAIEPGKEPSVSKRILLEELAESVHPELTENVIFWALESYAQKNKGTTWGGLIAATIVARIREEEGGEILKDIKPLS